MIFENEKEMVMVSDFMNNAKFDKLGVKECSAVLNAVEVVNEAARRLIEKKQARKNIEEAAKKNIEEGQAKSIPVANDCGFKEGQAKVTPMPKEKK